MEGIYLEIEQTGVLSSSVLLNDVAFTAASGNSSGFPRPQPVYVPVQSVGSINLPYTSTTALSFESGSIRGFITAGYITATFRFGAAFKDALQLNSGWANYNDTATALVPIVAAADIWTQVTCDGLGAQTVTDYLPPTVTQLWDTTTNELDFSELNVGDVVTVRIDITTTPSINNSDINCRIHFNAFGGFDLPSYLGTMASGAGVEYQFVLAFPFYIGSADVRDQGAKIEISVDSGSTVQVQGLFIKVG